MKWAKNKNGDWEAKGKAGDFLIWRYGKWWKIRWRSADGKEMEHLPIAYSIKTAKDRCERHDKWEA